MTASTNIRVDRETHEELKRLAELRSQSQGQVVHDAVEALKRDMFFEEMKRGYERLREEGDWDAYQSEIEELEGTLQDGLAADDGTSGGGDDAEG